MKGYPQISKFQSYPPEEADSLRIFSRVPVQARLVSYTYEAVQNRSDKSFLKFLQNSRKWLPKENSEVEGIYPEPPIKLYSTSTETKQTK